MSAYRERLADVIRAEVAGVDLEDMGHEVRINAMREDGTMYAVGYVSAALCYQNPVGAALAVSRLKFGRDRASHSALPAQADNPPLKRG